MTFFSFLCIETIFRQMYNTDSKLTIAKTRYKFRKGYLQVSLADKKELRQELMQVLGISSLPYFSVILNSGIIDVSLPRFEAVNKIFARRNITDVWEITEIQQSSQQEKAK